MCGVPVCFGGLPWVVVAEVTVGGEHGRELVAVRVRRVGVAVTGRAPVGVVISAALAPGHKPSTVYGSGSAGG